MWDLIFFGRNPANPDATRKRDGFRQWLTAKFEANAPFEIVRLGTALPGYGNASQTYHVVDPLLKRKLRKLFKSYETCEGNRDAGL